MPVCPHDGAAGELRGARAWLQLMTLCLRCAQLPTADEAEFWVDPEKVGWLQSQGEHIKNWRRRWFVLKDGFLFRFASADISATSKPRGVVDLSKVCIPDVTPPCVLQSRMFCSLMLTCHGQALGKPRASLPRGLKSPLSALAIGNHMGALYCEAGMFFLFLRTSSPLLGFGVSARLKNCLLA